MKRATKTQRAQRDLIAALGVLRQLTKEVGGNYLASLQADVASVERAVRQAGGGELPDRKRLAQFCRMLKTINDLDVKPQKGRRRDLKQLDRRISELTNIASDW
jgi:hypothetical protein